MITALQVEQIMWNWVFYSDLKTEINGGVYRNARPNNSTKEDIVINSIVTNGAEFLIQDAVLNVNLHIPNAVIAGSEMPNHYRYDALNPKVIQVLKEGFNQYFTFWTDSTDLIQETDGSWFLNVRLRFKYHNNLHN